MTALTVTQKSSPSVADELNVHLRDLMEALNYTHYNDLKKKFNTFTNKLLVGKKSPPFKTSTYTDSSTGRTVITTYMTRSLAMKFCMWADVVRGYDAFDALQNASQQQNQISFSTVDLSLSVRDMAEVYNTSYDSMNATFSRERKRLLYEFPELAQQCVLADGRWRFTPAFALLVHRTGKAATLARGKQLLEKVAGQKLLT